MFDDVHSFLLPTAEETALVLSGIKLAPDERECSYNEWASPFDLEEVEDDGL